MGVAKQRNILDVYRDFKKKDPSVVYAFGDAEFFTFYMADSHRKDDVPVGFKSGVGFNIPHCE